MRVSATSAAQGVLFELLVPLPLAGIVGILVGRAGLEEVGVSPMRFWRRSNSSRAAGAHQFDGLVQLLKAALERTHQRVSRARLAALENAHGEARCGAVEDARLVVGLGDVAGRRVVELLLRCGSSS